MLDDPVSMRTIMCSTNIPGFEEALLGLGQVWGLNRFGLGAKLYPSCGYTHRCIDGALELHDRLGAPKADEVAYMALSRPDFHLAILPCGVPNSPEQTLSSAPWCAAVALATSRCVGTDFTEGGSIDPTSAP